MKQNMKHLTGFKLFENTYQTVILLKFLEKKFYKYTKRPYDADISIKMISNLEEAIEAICGFDELMKLIDDFISEHDQKIHDIFIDREDNVLISQPEILLIWFLYLRNSYYLKHYWQDFSTLDELKDIVILWGVSLE